MRLMRLVSSARVPRTDAARSCATCAHFRASAAHLEAQLPGLRALSSAHAAVRSDDGLCARHERYLSAGYGCADFRAAG